MRTPGAVPEAAMASAEMTKSTKSTESTKSAGVGA
jgi:hypothetical protein